MTDIGHFRTYQVGANVATGKDEGVKELAAASTFANYCVAKYVWVDAAGNTRAKSKTCTHKPATPDDCGIWMYNGAACGQATPAESDVYLVPRAVFDDPFRGNPHVMVLCECVTSVMEPATGNYRAMCSEVADKNAHHDFWFGIEQEYTLVQPGKMGEVGTEMYAGDSAAQGGYYCGVGTEYCAKGLRALMDEHYAACMAAGVKIGGTNTEAAPGQGEFQIGPCVGCEAADHLTMARHILKSLGEKYEYAITFEPKLSDDFSGSGMHVNLSSKETRAEGGLQVIEKIARAYGRKAKEHMAAYGDNSKRLTNPKTGDAPDGTKFDFAIASRSSSIRIPRNVGITGRGHFEDRRPAANADPYQVTGLMMKTAGETLGK